MIKHEDNLRNINQKTPKELVVRLDASEQTDRPKGPFMVPMNHDLNNDIYFIGKRRDVKYDDCKRMDRSTRLIRFFFQP